jgi:hypothetical protein
MYTFYCVLFGVTIYYLNFDTNITTVIQRYYRLFMLPSIVHTVHYTIHHQPIHTSRIDIIERMLTINFTRTSAARHFYFNRIVCLWNSIQSVVPINTSESLYVIKRKLIKHFWSHFSRHFDPSNTCTYHLVCSCTKCHDSNFKITPILFCTLV